MDTQNSIASRHARMFDRHTPMNWTDTLTRLAIGVVVIGGIFGSLYVIAG